MVGCVVDLQLVEVEHRLYEAQLGQRGLEQTNPHESASLLARLLVQFRERIPQTAGVTGHLAGQPRALFAIDEMAVQVRTHAANHVRSVPYAA